MADRSDWVPEGVRRKSGEGSPDFKRGGYRHGGRNPYSDPSLARAEANATPIDQLIYAFREATKCGALAFDPSNVEPPANAEKFEVYSKGVILPATADAQWTATDSLYVQSLRSPIALDSATTNPNDAWVSSITGAGQFGSVKVPPGYAAVIEEFGIDTWSRAAEWELIWNVVYNPQSSNSATTLPQGTEIIPPTRGWRGSTSHPRRVLGARAVPPGAGSSQQVVIGVKHTGVNTSTAKSTPHYARAVLRGWFVPVAMGFPINQSVGGGSCS